MKAISKYQIEQCLKADRKTQRLVFDTLYAPMFRICQRYLVNTALTEDCVLKGMMKMFQQLESFVFEDEFSLYKWLRQIMVNEALMELRKKNNFYLMPEEHLPELPDQQDILSSMQAEDINKMILMLPTGYRTVLNLFVVEGYSHKEIAEMLQIKESTSKTQYMKAKSKLKELIQQENGELNGTFGK
ncbi:MAG: RNA polymerase sigma factor [Bacteroidia bacterium]